ncbi:hypothetical protein DC522_25330 [Microvirga sp. KLBC 81]|uniref:tetratricopeptide repeat protein n=1 Tax=Microvirga sp. KLBC 81 TaxID=1862707 RepID=UPI000D50D332|nr:tetratricopeptide repeat protein [Microvirga sp. KLBC 81]PVE21682.1 hypothetical protein DC522_25330 [Microvirga sp. KLBC 81]
MNSHDNAIRPQSCSTRPTTALLAVLAILLLGGCTSWDKPVFSVETTPGPDLLGAKDIDPSMRERIARAIGWNTDEESLRDELKQEPSNVDAAMRLTKILLAQKRLHEALAVLDNLLAAVPDDLRALNAKGVVLDNEGRHDEAQALYRQALATEPANQMLRNNLNLSLALDSEDDAAKVIQQPLWRGSRALARSR